MPSTPNSVEGMTLPETDLACIRHCCDSLVPEHLREQVKAEADTTDRHVTIVKVRQPGDEQREHTRCPSARPRYTKTTRLWSLYQHNHDLKLHAYDIDLTQRSKTLSTALVTAVTRSSSDKTPRQTQLHPLRLFLHPARCRRDKASHRINKAIVGNPPYSIRWEGDSNPLLINDERFAPVGVLAPKSKADLAFTMHILSCLAVHGTAAQGQGACLL